ncbi:MAG: hypothetical protein ACR2N1_06510 [Rubripirellula sp.]|nr:hypothetical protein [Planctomycetaceae bacterium]
MPQPAIESSRGTLFTWSEPVIMCVWQVFIFLSLKNAIFHGFEESGTWIASITTFIRPVFALAAPWLAAVFIAGYALVFALPAIGKSNRLLLDCMGFFLIARTFVGFVMLNLLIINPLSDNMLLLRQFLCFMPALILGWGWLYWRLDQGARRKGRQLLLFPEDSPNDLREPLSTFDYYYHSAMVAFIFELSEVEPLTKPMKVLFLINAGMMLDLVGLVLTQAIGLAGTG